MNRPLQLHQALVDAGVPTIGTARSFVHGLCSRLGVKSDAADLKWQFFHLLSYLLAEAPLLACSWVSDYVACSTALASDDPEEAYILQPQGVAAWCEQSAAALQHKVEAFLHSAPAQECDQVLELGQAAQSLLSISQTVQAAVAGRMPEVQQLTATLQLLQQATRVLLVLERLQQQQPGSGAPLIFSSASRNLTAEPGTAMALGSSFGGQQVLCPHYASFGEWQQQLAALRAAAPEERLFLDDLLQQLQMTFPQGSPAVSYPFPDVLSCVNTLFLNIGGGSNSETSSSGSAEGWHSKLAVLLYYLLDGGWLTGAERFSQGFQLPLTMVQQWQCHYLLDAAKAATAASSAVGGGGGGSRGDGAVAALDTACQLLRATACPDTPFRFVEALLAAGKPATALAVQRARSAGSSGSRAAGSSFGEAQVLLRVQLECGLLTEAFGEMRRHCSQVHPSQRAAHISKLVRQLAEWALDPQPNPSTTKDAAAAAASQMQHQLKLRDGQQQTPASTAATVAAASSKLRPQQLMELPFDAAEEGALLSWMRERMKAGEPGGHLMPLYLLQRGRVLEALSAYADFKASPAAAAASSAQAHSEASSVNSPLWQRQLALLMAAAADSLPPALRAAATAADGSSGVRSVLQGVGVNEASRQGATASAALPLLRRGVEPPVFLAPLVAAAADAAGAVAAIEADQPPAAAAGILSGPAAAGGARSAAAGGGRETARKPPAAAGRDDSSGGFAPLLFEQEVLAEAGPGTVRLGGGQQAGIRDDGPVVPLLFGTPAPAAGAATARAGPAGGLFGGAPDTSSTGVATTGQHGMSEAEFERDVLGVQPPVQRLFATPAPAPAAIAGTKGYGSTRHVSKRLRKTPL